MPEITQITLGDGVTYDIADKNCRDDMPKSLIDLKEDAKSVHVTQYEKTKWNSMSEGGGGATEVDIGTVEPTEDSIQLWVDPGEEYPVSDFVDNTAEGGSELINKLSTGSSTPQDNDYYISQYVGGGTTTTTYHRRPHLSLWLYIKEKLKADTTSATTFSCTFSSGATATQMNYYDAITGRVDILINATFSSGKAANVELFNIPAAYRPKTNAYGICCRYNNAAGGFFPGVGAGANGAIWQGVGGSCTQITFYIFYYI